MANGYKTGGRQKGTPNAATIKVRKAVIKVLTAQLKTFNELYNELSTKEKLDISIKLIGMVLPKPVITELLADQPEEPIKVTLNL